MATDWSEEAKAKRSASAKKAAETRAANQAKARQTSGTVKEHVRKVLGRVGLNTSYPYITNSRVARWALSNVSVLAMMRGTRHIRWGRPTLQMQLPFNPEMLRG